MSSKLQNVLELYLVRVKVFFYQIKVILGVLFLVVFLCKHSSLLSASTRYFPPPKLLESLPSAWPPAPSSPPTKQAAYGASRSMVLSREDENLSCFLFDAWKS